MPGENLPGERIESLVDELEGIIQESKAPFGKAAEDYRDRGLLQHP